MNGRMAGYFLLGAVTITAYAVTGLAGWCVWQAHRCARRHRLSADDLLLGGS